VDQLQGGAHLIAPNTTIRVAAAVNSVTYGPNDGIWPWDIGPWFPTSTLVVNGEWFKHNASEVRFYAPYSGQKKIVFPGAPFNGGVDNAVGSTFQLLKAGATFGTTTTGTPYNDQRGNARTAIGLDATGNHLFLMVTSGQLYPPIIEESKRSSADGFTVSELQECLTIVRPFGSSLVKASDAMMLDGGHAAQLWLWDQSAPNPMNLRHEIVPRGAAGIGDGPYRVPAGLAVTVSSHG
jgi:hypothetical protein